jgi:hypothetical protein
MGMCLDVLLGSTTLPRMCCIDAWHTVNIRQVLLPIAGQEIPFIAWWLARRDELYAQMDDEHSHKTCRHLAAMVNPHGQVAGKL